LLMFNC